jgi:hypothetical protein
MNNIPILQWEWSREMAGMKQMRKGGPEQKVHAVQGTVIVTHLSLSLIA